MKLSNLVLAAVMFVGSSAFAVAPAGQNVNAKCAHSDKGASVTADNSYLNILSQPKPAAPQKNQGGGTATRENRNGNG